MEKYTGMIVWWHDWISLAMHKHRLATAKRVVLSDLTQIGPGRNASIRFGLNRSF